MQTALIFIGLLSVLGLARAVEPSPNDGAFSDASQPEGCYALRRTQRTGFEKYFTGELITDPAEAIGAPPVYYQYDDPTMTSREAAYADIITNRMADILCVGDQISILAPIYTNGGDVLILANRLDVRAPIDTRIYFNIANRTRYYRKASTVGGAAYEEFFASYYRNNPEGIPLGSGVYAPELPSGALIHHSSNDATRTQEDGSPPPVLAEDDRPLERSGSITIFAKSIDVAQSLQDGTRTGSELCQSTARRLFAFEAGGMRGGKGGIGSPPGCTAVPHGGAFSCAKELLVTSGYNTPGGPGGDAGNVYIYSLGGNLGSDKVKALTRATDVAGGAPGPSAKYRTLDAWEVDAGVSKSICERHPVGQHAVQRTGESGVVRFGTSNVLGALERADSFTSTVDARPNMDVKDLLLRARTNTIVVHRSLREFLRSRLTKTVMSAQKAWASALADQVAGSQSVAHTSVEPFATISSDLTVEGSGSLSSNVSGLATRIGSLDIVQSGNPAQAYFSHTGGAFRITNPDATAALNGKLIGEDLAKIIEVDASQLETLNRIELAVDETLYTTRQANLLKKISAVQEKITEIETIPQRTGASFDEIAASIQKNAPAIAKFVGAVVAEDYLQAAQLFPAAMAGLQDIDNTVYADINSGPRPGLKEMKIALRGLTSALQELNDYYVSEKSALIEAQFNYAAQELEARQRVTSRVEGRVSLGDDLIKHSFIAYYLDPLQSKTTLAENLREAAKFLDGKTDYYAMFSLPPISNECQLDAQGEKNLLACVRFPASRAYYVAETRVSATSFPAWVVAPHPRKLALPTYGAPIRIIKKTTLPSKSRLPP
ncbi:MULTISPECIES: hypothetical protein [unclassified Caballeronia]|uniref:hypothetical protein n=1 Tax=unclassified Caballeronia TaxID=2646786 RepID=UPI0020279771|nr:MULTISPECIES: hypothetical protein [unclassified Caballeronia]